MGEEEAAPGVPEWLVTFGDMMSLLLTFFIMLFSMSEMKQEQKYQAVMEALHQMIFSDVQRLFVEGDQAGMITGVLSLSDVARFRAGSCRACSEARLGASLS